MKRPLILFSNDSKQQFKKDEMILLNRRRKHTWSEDFESVSIISKIEIAHLVEEKTR